MENTYLSLATYPDIVPVPFNYANNNSTPFAHGELKKSLEAIVLTPKSKSEISPLENMFPDFQT